MALWEVTWREGEEMGRERGGSRRGREGRREERDVQRRKGEGGREGNGERRREKGRGREGEREKERVLWGDFLGTLKVIDRINTVVVWEAISRVPYRGQ